MMSAAHQVRGATEAFRSGVWFKALDAIMTAALRPTLSPTACLRAILKPRSSNTVRVAAAMKLLDMALPGVAARLSRWLYRPEQLPFAARRIELMSYGSGATVFLVESAAGQHVLKLYRRSLGKRLARAEQIARLFQEKHETLSGWYNSGRFKLVPAACFLLVHGPIFGAPAAAVLQPFIQGLIRDPFLDFTDDELLRLLYNQPALREQFIFFAERTLHIFSQQERCFDLVGRDNLMLVANGEEMKLLVVDNGIFDLPALKQKSPTTFFKLQERMDRLKLLLDCLRLLPADAVSRQQPVALVL